MTAAEKDTALANINAALDALYAEYIGKRKPTPLERLKVEKLVDLQHRVVNVRPKG